MNRVKILGAGSALVLLGCAAGYWWSSPPSPAAGPDGMPSADSANSARYAPGGAGSAPSIRATPTADRRLADPRKYFKQAVAEGGPEINDAIEILLPAWAARAPREALDYADSLPEGPLRESILHRIVQTWSETDAAAALDWIANRVNAAERHSFAMAVCRQIAQADPLTAIGVAERTGVARDNPDFTPFLVEMWAEQDAPSALTWVRLQPEGDTRDAYMARVVLKKAQGAEYDIAVKIALHEIPAGPRQDDALIAIVNQWAQRDLESAEVWVETFSIANPLRGRAFAEIEGARRVRTAGERAGP